ncbi:hypothetical protein GCM10028797_31470 [Dyella agri]
MKGKNPNSRRGLRVVLPLCLLGSVGVAHAMPGGEAGNAGLQPKPATAPTADQAQPDIAGLGQPVSDASLDHARGGFDLGGGLMASFGLKEQTYINGVLAMSTSINIPDISKITQQQAAALASTLDDLDLVQSGPGNSVASGKAAAAPIAGSGASNGVVGTHAPNKQSTSSPAMDAPAASLGVPALVTGVVSSAVSQNTQGTAAAASALAQGGALAQVVQNTLNNQSIQTFTTLNISVNTLQMLRQMNLQSTLQSAQLLSLSH